MPLWCPFSFPYSFYKLLVTQLVRLTFWTPLSVAAVTGLTPFWGATSHAAAVWQSLPSTVRKSRQVLPSGAVPSRRARRHACHALSSRPLHALALPASDNFIGGG